MSIPKIIHYCWFGRNPLPELAEKCIASWKKFLPDYEIKEWNESNYDVHKIPYIAQAYDAKKYAFVSDYARFDILYQYGGIYFDTDVEVIKDLTPIVDAGAFMGIELPGLINSGLGIAGQKGLPIFKEIIESYEKDSFQIEDIVEMKTVVTRVTDIFINHGFISENRMQQISEIKIYPAEFFCPKDNRTMELHLTKNTYTIHHYDASWVDARTKKMILEKNAIENKLKNTAVASLLKNLCVLKKIILSFCDSVLRK